MNTINFSFRSSQSSCFLSLLKYQRNKEIRSMNNHGIFLVSWRSVEHHRSDDLLDSLQRGRASRSREQNKRSAVLLSSSFRWEYSHAMVSSLQHSLDHLLVSSTFVDFSLSISIQLISWKSTLETSFLSDTVLLSPAKRERCWKLLSHLLLLSCSSLAKWLSTWTWGVLSLSVDSNKTTKQWLGVISMSFFAPLSWKN